ncbi:pyridoxine biosynthesis protein [Grosmannia clavigera kw1407]|uniref:pyridoxal 5'-phosphate synthase (glutamine hydrolyzing) n=1 Tax=Grosmannia clavigera (strain kw1407 / UAMH 11150) TaxID=655863 RepID=F0XKT4_GROCL|nr:pyridoxine biosynthesis protein [Grosmannia clavigera kw1407]EFX01576.1 pyridoxine biosynthesis protein [Grosmannia clavigera kw1407]
MGNTEGFPSSAISTNPTMIDQSGSTPAASGLAATVPTATPSRTVKAGLAQMLKGGVIMDVTTAEQARIAEEAGACAVMALERVPADIRHDGGVARMADPDVIRAVQAAVTIPVMAKARIGHSVEAQILEALGVDFIDESEVLTVADHERHIGKDVFRAPFVCGCRDLGQALRRIAEGAVMLRTKGEAGTGDVSAAVRHVREVGRGITDARQALSRDGVPGIRRLAATLDCDPDLLLLTARLGRLPVVTFAAGGVATPADAALLMQLGCDGVFVGSGIFKSGDAAKRARAIVQATTHFKDPKVLADISAGLGEAMVGINCDALPAQERYAERG